MFSRKPISTGLATVGAGLILVLFCSEQARAYGAGYRQPTPCPCAADGTCLPKPETWGHYKTHWRPWPGDVVRPQAPEYVEGEATELPPLVLPDPEQEDQRDPIKKKQPDSPEDEPATDHDLDNAIDPVGDLPELPVFDPQSYHPPNLIKLPDIDRNAIPKGTTANSSATSRLPALSEWSSPINSHQPQSESEDTDDALLHQDDTPPALPESLRSFSALRFSPQLFRLNPKRADLKIPQPRNPLPAAQSQQVHATAPLDQRLGVPRLAVPSNPEEHIERAHWNQPASVQLVNPAAVVASDPLPADYQ